MAQLPTRDEKDAFYFKHRSNMRMDPRIRALIHVHGHKGYGWYWIIMEILRDQKDFDMNVSGKYFYASLAGELSSNENSCTADQARQFLQDCVAEFHLFHMEHSNLYSQDLNQDMTAMLSKSKTNRDNGLKGVEARKLKKLQEAGATGQLSLSESLPTAERPVEKGQPKVELQDKTRQNYTRKDESEEAPPPPRPTFQLNYKELMQGFPVYFNDLAFQKKFEDFVFTRSVINKPLHQRAANSIMQRICMYAQDDIQYAVSMLDKSVRNNKPDVYALDEKEKKSRFDKYQEVSNAIR